MSGRAHLAVIGSGGLSHFVIDEDFDRMILDAVVTGDAQRLCAIDESVLQAGIGFVGWR